MSLTETSPARRGKGSAKHRTSAPPRLGPGCSLQGWRPAARAVPGSWGSHPWAPRRGRLKRAWFCCPRVRHPARRGSCFPTGLPVDCFGFFTEGGRLVGKRGTGSGGGKTVKIHRTIVRQIFVEVHLPARRSRALALSHVCSHSPQDVRCCGAKGLLSSG